MIFGIKLKGQHSLLPTILLNDLRDKQIRKLYTSYIFLSNLVERFALCYI